MSNSPMNANEKKVGNEAPDAAKTSQTQNQGAQIQGSNANAGTNSPAKMSKDATAKPVANAPKTDASASKPDAAKTDANAPVKKAS